MLKNPNQKVIKRMAWNALKVNRRKTITLLLAVLLSSFLVFTIFTVGDSYFRLQKIQNISSHREQHSHVIMVSLIRVCMWAVRYSGSLWMGRKNRSGLHPECGTDLGR